VTLRALDRKLLRDLRRIAVQAGAIALLVACAVAVFVGSVATWRALERSRAVYYEEFRFAEVFAQARRVPEPIAAALAGVPGVAEVDTRVVAPATVFLPGDDAPVTARVLSVPEDGPRLNRVYLRAGSALAPGAADEVLVSEGFALANRLAPGDRLEIVVNGRRHGLRIAGIALSPEVIYAVRPGEIFPDDRHFGILWMARDALAAAMDLEGAFDDVSFLLSPGANEAEVIAAVDRILDPYGGVGAFGRERHVSHRFLSDEIMQLKNMAAVMPSIFLGVAAFLVSVVVSRIVATQRQQIGMLKAIGYSSGDVGFHFAKLVLVMALAGSAAGAAGGVAMGKALAVTYAEFYKLPVLVYEGDGLVILLASALAVLGSLAGALGAVRRAVRLPPAVAMRPAPPPTFRPTLVERLGAGRLLSPAGRMVLRDLGRRPARAALSALGIGFAVSILLLAWFSNDAIDVMFERVLVSAQRQDATVTFNSPRGEAAAVELRTLPGVRRVEPFRAVPATLRAGHRSYRGAIQGHDPEGELTRIVDADGSIVPLPPAGLVLSEKLAQMLGVGPGDEVTVEPSEGRRAVRTFPVAAVVVDFLGVQATCSRAWLSRTLGEDPLLSGAFLSLDLDRLEELKGRIREMPKVAGLTLRAATVDAFRALIEEYLAAYLSVVAALGLAIAAGVVYNSARVTYAERERELATLRVIGFTRGEIWRIVAGEIATYVVAAIPMGWAIGLAFVHFTAQQASTEFYRLPTVISRETYAAAALSVALAAAAVLVVAVRWIRRLDLVEVLKSRE